MKKIYSILLTVLLLSFANVSVVYSQEVKEEQSEFEKAKRFYDQGQYEEARVLFVAFSDVKSKKLYEQCLTLLSEQKLAQEAYEAKKFNTGIRYCEEILKVNPTDKFAQNLKNKCQKGIEQLQEERQQLFDDAVSSMSEEKLSQFIAKYNKQEEWVAKANVVLFDLPLWKTAKATNTKQSYQEYLSVSTSKIYEQSAKYMIGSLECEETWDAIKDSRSLSDFTTYKNKYETYKFHFAEADARIALLNGVDSYTKGDLNSAYYYFAEAKNSGNVSFLLQDEYQFKKATEYKKYSDLGASASISDLQTYLITYPNSDYCNEANNRIAKLYADQLTADSPKSSYNNIRTYAKDDATRNYVENKITAANHGRKKIIRSKYGKMFTWGIDGSIDLNDYGYTTQIGLDTRLGRYSNWINFTLGVNYEQLNLNKMYGSEDSSNNYNVAQIINIPAHLKLNLIPCGESCRIFIGCGYEYGIPLGSNEDEDLDVCEKAIMSYIPEIGFSFKHLAIDLYYKKYIHLYDEEKMYNLEGSFFKENTSNRDWFAGIRLIGYF